MNLINELLNNLNVTAKNKIAAYVGDNKDRFSELVNAFLNSSSRITQRASWPISYCVQKHPELIKPHLKRIINNLKNNNIHVAVKRNTLRMLQFVEIPKSLHGIALERCFHFFNDTGEPVAVRVFSMTVLGKVSKFYPEIKKELILLIEDQMPYASPGFKSRGKKVLKELRKN